MSDGVVYIQEMWWDDWIDPYVDYSYGAFWRQAEPDDRWLDRHTRKTASRRALKRDRRLQRRRNRVMSTLETKQVRQRRERKDQTHVR